MLNFKSGFCCLVCKIPVMVKSLEGTHSPNSEGRKLINYINIERNIVHTEDMQRTNVPNLGILYV